MFLYDESTVTIAIISVIIYMAIIIYGGRWKNAKEE